jgi:hypothetical protein
VTTSVPEAVVVPVPTSGRSDVLAWSALLMGLAVVVGALAAVFWSGVVDLPSYSIQNNGHAVITESELAQIVAADVWFAITGLLVGAGLGLVSWRWFRALGWPVALLAIAAALVAGVVCWQLGELIGPRDFAARLAAAEPGDLVPVSLQLHSLSALAIWAFAAVTPVLLISSLGKDEEDPPRRQRTRTPAGVASVDDRGVLTDEETVP